ncbi:hypothetical protein BE15_35555 [Sorangium cellulosum]|uniref:Uncharacterized protein n=2 Tax=Sorangium cellulosum TaxID=56 RepID=A0A150QXD6_SORCE|nr:hypothetical protein BE15_35555 [Sorangium cellulosum]
MEEPMNEQTSVEVRVPREMTPDERHLLDDELQAMRRLIFEGSQRERSFAAHVLHADAEHGALVLQRSAGGRIVGYFAMQIVERELSGGRVAIVRGESGAVGEHPASNDVVLRLALERLIRYMLARPGRPVYCLCSLAHPSSYALLSRFVDVTHTSPAESSPAGADEHMSALAASFDRESGAQGGLLAFEVARRESAPSGSCDFLHLYENPAVRCFVSAHPGPAEGHGLIALVPLSLGGMMRAAARSAGPAARRA